MTQRQAREHVLNLGGSTYAREKVRELRELGARTERASYAEDADKLERLVDWADAPTGASRPGGGEQISLFTEVRA